MTLAQGAVADVPMVTVTTTASIKNPTSMPPKDTKSEAHDVSGPRAATTEDSANFGGRPATRPSNKRPAHKMSVGLIDTYNTINKRYYEQKKA